MAVIRHGCDSFAQASPKTLDALGLDFAWRYLLGTPDKDLTVAEAQALRNGGKDIILNAENTATDADGGFASGVKFATSANLQADALGAPYINADGSLVGIVYSVDESRSAAQVLPYFQGLNSVRNGRIVGGYGGSEIGTMKQEGFVKVAGQANAARWSGFSTPDFPTAPWADFRQHLSTSFGGFAFDPQDQCSPSPECGFWLSPANIVIPTKPPHLPVPTEEAMSIALSLFGPNQIDRFDVGPAGNLVHRWYINGDPDPPPPPAIWHSEILAGGLVPLSELDGPALWPVDGFIHLFGTRAIDGAQVHVYWDPAGGRWSTDIEG